MPTFDTPEPIAVRVDIVGDLRITASDRTDTVVTVTPLDPTKPADVSAAQGTSVGYSDGVLTVKAPKHWTRFTPFGGGESVLVTVEVPTGSTLDGVTGLGDLRGEGELGECRVKTAMGHIRLDHTGDLTAKSSHGDIAVDTVDGDASATTGSGDVRIGEVTGTATVKNSNGHTEIGRVDGEVKVRSANGDITIGSAGSSATAKTANGDVRILDVRAGAVVLETAAGDLDIGVQQDTAAWLDLQTRFGTVRNELDVSAAPAAGERSVEVRANTPTGDIVVRRVTDGGSDVDRLEGDR